MDGRMDAWWKYLFVDGCKMDGWIVYRWMDVYDGWMVDARVDGWVN